MPGLIHAVAHRASTTCRVSFFACGCIALLFVNGCAHDVVVPQQDKDPERVVSVNIAQSSVRLIVGQTYRPVADVVNDTTGQLSGVTWRAVDTLVATVISDGTVTAKAAGQTTIIATSRYRPGAAAAYALTVQQPSTKCDPDGFAISPSTVSLVTGATRLLLVLANCADAPLTWSSSAPSVASIDSLGFVRGNSPGTATITVRLAVDTSRSATARVTVTAPAAGSSASIGLLNER